MAARAGRVDAFVMLNELLHLTRDELPVLASAAGVVLLVSTFLGYWIGRKKDRPVLGVALGGLLMVPGLLVIALMPTRNPPLLIEWGGQRTPFRTGDEGRYEVAWSCSMAQGVLTEERLASPHGRAR